MVTMTYSFKHWLAIFYPDLFAKISFGGLECFTPQMKQEYFAWLQTDEGKRYLKGGDLYEAHYNRTKSDYKNQGN